MRLDKSKQEFIESGLNQSDEDQPRGTAILKINIFRTCSFDWRKDMS